MSRPYFDDLPTLFANNDTQALEAFGEHIHWGFWPDSIRADGSLKDFSEAAERLSRQLLSHANLKDGLRILDAGCGFGGTIALLNSSYQNLQLTGININSEQIERAKTRVVPQGGNQIEFIVGDACALPFADDVFDIVLAVECIFAFPSRERFFSEVKRVLAPEGTFILCDFLLPNWFGPLWKQCEGFTNRLVTKAYGEFTAERNPPINFWTFSQYAQLSVSMGFEQRQIEDITRNTLPTYPVVNQLMKNVDASSQSATAGLAVLSRMGLVRYVILSYSNLT
ncbi:class I SAM-dependent methyltransferase [Leptolyngbya sp. PCC 6406]|uniref:class I SAM-dependent methyltransferase n=1 Tax=Leptolyngbya sp. PCC 6406 TaxID=1173264 RepID=UPI0002AC00DC|nr:class I SAM-dependent methyltransferase [Leptolyngbya sp. PCC 6406]